MRCGNCEIGFRRVNGIHIGSQRLGMIPDTPCDAIVATKFNHGDDHERYKGGARRNWGVYVDGELLRTKAGVGRAWTTEAAALRAGRKAAPKRWHP